MKPIDVIIILLVAAFTIYVVLKAIRDKKKGKTGCGFDCSACASCVNCHMRNETQSKADSPLPPSAEQADEPLGKTETFPEP